MRYRANFITLDQRESFSNKTVRYYVTGGIEEILIYSSNERRDIKTIHKGFISKFTLSLWKRRHDKSNLNAKWFYCSCFNSRATCSLNYQEPWVKIFVRGLSIVITFIVIRAKIFGVLIPRKLWNCKIK